MRSAGQRHLPRGVFLLHEDRDILVVEKPAGLLTIGTDRDKTRTLHHALMDYVRKGNDKCRHRVFIVHRLDREVSGLLVFAKSVEAKDTLQAQWAGAEKAYQAIVHGKMPENSATLSSYLAENSSFVVYTTDDPKRGKLAHTRYTVLKEAGAFSHLAIDLLTGRKHQIRVQLADAGHPIVGDGKYGHDGKVHRRLALHATSIAFNHPYSGARMTFTSKVPSFFHALLGASNRR